MDQRTRDAIFLVVVWLTAIALSLAFWALVWSAVR